MHPPEEKRTRGEPPPTTHSTSPEKPPKTPVGNDVNSLFARYRNRAVPVAPPPPLTPGPPQKVPISPAARLEMPHPTHDTNVNPSKREPDGSVLNELLSRMMP